MTMIKGYYTMPHPPIMLPEVGGERSEEIINTIDACRKISKEIKELDPKTIVIVSPHGPMFSDAVAIYREEKLRGDMGKFGVPDLKMELETDVELVERITKLAYDEKIQMAVLDDHLAKDYDLELEIDHGAFVPLYFIREELKDFKIVHITYGLLSKLELYRFGKVIEDAVEAMDRDVVFIASGDLSHRLKTDGPYTYDARGKEFDGRLIELFKKGDMEGIFEMDEALVDAAGQCGLKSYYIMMGAMGNRSFRGNLLSYEGNFGVGYMVMDFELEEVGEDLLEKLKLSMEKCKEDMWSKEDDYVKLARMAINSWVKDRTEIKVPREMKASFESQRFGTFVSIKKSGRLRGCIGTILPVRENVGEEIIKNAISASTADPRFYPVREEELEELCISVDVIRDIEACDIKDLDPSKYGVIVTHGLKRGLLLPDLEGIDTVDKQLEVALHKAGIEEGEEYEVERFKVVRHEVEKVGV